MVYSYVGDVRQVRDLKLSIRFFEDQRRTEGLQIQSHFIHPSIHPSISISIDTEPHPQFSNHLGRGQSDRISSTLEDSNHQAHGLLRVSFCKSLFRCTHPIRLVPSISLSSTQDYQSHPQLQSTTL